MHTPVIANRPPAPAGERSGPGKRSRRWRRSATALALSLLGACGGGGPPTDSLAVEFAGCESLIRGRECLLRGGDPLVVFAPVVRISELTVRGAAIDTAVSVQGGHRLSLRPDRLPATVSLATPQGARWQLDLADAEEREPLLSAARRQRWKLDAAAIEAARDGLDAGDPGVEGTWHHYLSGILALAAGDTEEAIDRLGTAAEGFAAHGRLIEQVDATVLAVHALNDSRRFARAQDLLARIGEDAPDAFLATYLRHYYEGVLAGSVGNLRGALQSLAAAAAIAERLGDDARRRFAQQWLAVQLQAVGRSAEADTLLQDLARDEWYHTHPCARAQLRVNTAWNRLLAAEAGRPTGDPRPPLESALATYGEACETTGEEVANALVNLALAHVQAGDADAAATALARIEAGTLSTGLRLWTLEVQARIALLRDAPDQALAHYETLDALALAQYDDEARWRAHVGRATALAALNRPDAALAAYGAADALLGRQTLQVPIHAGRETFLARREWATRRHLSLLLAQDRTEEAYALARRARIRILETVRREDRLDALSPTEQKVWAQTMEAYARFRDELAGSAAQDWQLAADELAAVRERRALERSRLAARLDAAFAMLDGDSSDTRLPPRRAGETVLLYYPLEGSPPFDDRSGPDARAPAGPDARAPERWAAFVHSDAGIEHAVLACPALAPVQRDHPPADPSSASGAAEGLAQALARCLFDPFAGRIQGARRLRILTAGALESVDLHALPWGDSRPLAATVPVTYALDLPPPDASVPGAAPARALIVADPRGDLPAARREARQLETRLRAYLPEAPALLVGADADLAGLRHGLDGAGLFHYAGHAVFAGESGWSSMLPLAGNTDFGVGDILSLPRAPRLVVLSGCETGRAGSGLPVQGMGIAHAFLAAGSEAVLAAVRPVEDDLAAQLTTDFYGHLTAGMPPDAALAATQLALWQRAPDRDWFSFRLIAR